MVFALLLVLLVLLVNSIFNNLIGRIILVDWSKYQTAYGPANQKLTLSETQLTTSYETNLIQLLKDNLSVFQKIKTTAEPNSDLAEFATTIIEVLNQSNED